MIEKPLIVAELSANHNNSLSTAVETVRRFATAGASAIKLQTYKPETMTLDLPLEEFKVDGANNLWGGRTLFDLYQEAMTPWEWHEELFDEARKAGIFAFSTPFDSSAVDFLESIGCPMYKIASFEVVDVKLIEYAAMTGKPMIISTGMANLAEIDLAVQAARRAGCKDITLLKTTSSYPASPKYSNLRSMPILGQVFGTKFGISDHTLGIGASLAAICLGASVVEKHVTLNSKSGGVDSSFSIEPDDFSVLVREAQSVVDSLGTVHFGPSQGDYASLAFRRSIYLSKDVKAGEILSKENSRAVRPGGGLPIFEYDLALGLKFLRDYRAGTPVNFEMFK